MCTELWLSNRRAAQCAAPALDAPSREHIEVLHRLAVLQSLQPRRARLAASALTVRCRELLAAVRGAGAELLLRDWLRDGARTGHSSLADAEERLSALIRLLESCRLKPRDADATFSIRALLVLVPEN
jgi:hypothetical protein